MATQVLPYWVGVLVLTLDVQVASVRENEVRNGFSVPLRFTPKLVIGGMLRPRWMVETFARTLLSRGIPHFDTYPY